MSGYTGGPAFPISEEILRHPDPRHVMGMTLRDYFAAKAMQGFMANKDRPCHLHPKDDAEYFYRIADAMLAERAK